MTYFFVSLRISKIGYSFRSNYETVTPFRVTEQNTEPRDKIRSFSTASFHGWFKCFPNIFVVIGVIGFLKSGSSGVSLRRYAEGPPDEAMSPLFSVGNLCPNFFQAIFSSILLIFSVFIKFFWFNFWIVLS